MQKRLLEIGFKIISGALDQAKIKNLLKNHTAIGEYCGNQNYQHFVVYPIETILFYALVSKDINDVLCVPPCLALEQIKDAGLSCIDYQIEEVDNIKDFGKTLTKIYYDIAGRSLEDMGEGVVVYLSAVSDEAGGGPVEAVVGIGKMKTVEYRVYRNIREGLRAKVGDPFASYDKKVTKMINTFGKAFRDQSHYVSFAKKAVAVLKSLGNPTSISSKFTDFIAITNRCMENDRKTNNTNIE